VDGNPRVVKLVKHFREVDDVTCSSMRIMFTLEMYLRSSSLELAPHLFLCRSYLIHREVL